MIFTDSCGADLENTIICYENENSKSMFLLLIYRVRFI